MVAEMAGADQITCHIRSDRRHIQDADLPPVFATPFKPNSMSKWRQRMK